jgi:hypothetical protein
MSELSDLNPTAEELMPENLTETPVIFRWEWGSVVAVFPADPATPDSRFFTAFVPVWEGANDYHNYTHSAASFSWYRDTVPASPEEYKTLKKYLEEKFEYDDLKVYPDFEQRFNDERRAALTRLYRTV